MDPTISDGFNLEGECSPPFHHLKKLERIYEAIDV